MRRSMTAEAIDTVAELLPQSDQPDRKIAARAGGTRLQRTNTGSPERAKSASPGQEEVSSTNLLAAPGTI